MRVSVVAAADQSMGFDHFHSWMIKAGDKKKTTYPEVTVASYCVALTVGVIKSTMQVLHCSK